MSIPPITILAGDIGGTSARLACFRCAREVATLVAKQHYTCAEHDSLEEILRDFLPQTEGVIERACFGVAGTVQADSVLTPNLPWAVHGSALARVLNLPTVELINDLSANALGIAVLKPEDLVSLQQGVPAAKATIGVISVGTGLGETCAIWDGAMHRPLPSEAGHADFAPRNELESELLLYLRRLHGRVSYERVLSGPGLLSLYRFFMDRSPAIAKQPGLAGPEVTPAAIATAAINGTCPACTAALDLFVSCLGAEAGNLALRGLTRGGLYLGGGIAPKIRAKLAGPEFMAAFRAKGRLSPLLEQIPVQLILNENTALLGAARWAVQAGTGRALTCSIMA